MINCEQLLTLVKKYGTINEVVGYIVPIKIYVDIYCFMIYTCHIERKTNMRSD